MDSSRGLNVKYLFLAGDIANNDRSLKKFLITLAQYGTWEKIFYLPGNHEYYGKVRPNIRDSIKTYQDLFDDTEFKDKIICIHHKYLILDEFVLAGATFWYKPNTVDTFISNDYNKIKGYGGKKISKNLIEILHDEDKAFLEMTLNKPVEYLDDNMTMIKPIVIVTHHPPNSDLDNHGNSETNCDNLLEQANYWLFGHTHEVINMEVNGCQLYNNPLGYPGELDYNIGFTFEILNL